MSDYRIKGETGDWVVMVGPELDEQTVLDAGLAIEQRAGFTHRPEKWW